MVIKILGSGCTSCTQLEQKTKQALKHLALDADVIKVTDIQDILAYGIMSLPALVINETVVMYGQSPSIEEIMKLIVAHK